MGSYLQTCCISNQIIDSGYIIPIIVEHDRNVKVKQKPDSNVQVVNPIATICYSHDLFRPLGFMFSGEYYDYGQFAIDWNINLEMFKCFIKYLKENTFITLAGENPYHHLPFDANSEFDIDSITINNAQETFDILQEKIDKCSVYIKHFYPGGSPRLLKFASINQYIGNEIKSIYKKSVITDWNISNNFEFIKQIKASPEEVKLFCDSLFKDFSYEDSANLKSYFLSDYNSVHISNILYYTLNKEESFSLETIILLRKLKFIISGLNLMNVGLKPNIYGSQCYDNEQGRLFSNLMDKVKEYNLKYEYDEDE